MVLATFKKNDNKRELLKEVLREVVIFYEEVCIQRLLINLILLPFFLFLYCIYLFWWLFTKGEEFLYCAVCRCQLLLLEAGESGKVAPTAVDAVPTTSEEPAAPPTAEEQAPAAPMGTVVAVHEGESLVPYATVLSVEQ